MIVLLVFLSKPTVKKFTKSLVMFVSIYNVNIPCHFGTSGSFMLTI